MQLCIFDTYIYMQSYCIYMQLCIFDTHLASQSKFGTIHLNIQQTRFRFIAEYPEFKFTLKSKHLRRLSFIPKYPALDTQFSMGLICKIYVCIFLSWKTDGQETAERQETAGQLLFADNTLLCLLSIHCGMIHCWVDTFFLNTLFCVWALSARYANHDIWQADRYIAPSFSCCCPVYCVVILTNPLL